MKRQVTTISVLWLIFLGVSGLAQQPPSPPAVDKKPAVVRDKDDKDQVRARLTIDVPAGARVFLDGVEMKSPLAKRVFLTSLSRLSKLIWLAENRGVPFPSTELTAPYIVCVAHKPG